MPRGGARNRSGPQPDEHSLKSAKVGYTLTTLPAEGYTGRIPRFPLPRLLVRWEYFEDGRKVREVDDTATDDRAEREAALWKWAWRTPQASAWITQPWRWHTVAMWVRTAALCETADATAADKGSLHRFADQVGLTPAGMKENGWKVATDQVAPKREEKAAAVAPARVSARDRFKVVGGAG